jgi:hypothetical protein
MRSIVPLQHKGSKRPWMLTESRAQQGTAQSQALLWTKDVDCVKFIRPIADEARVPLGTEGYKATTWREVNDGSVGEKRTPAFGSSVCGQSREVLGRQKTLVGLVPAGDVNSRDLICV